jgi:hypothetical protein
MVSRSSPCARVSCPRRNRMATSRLTPASPGCATPGRWADPCRPRRTRVPQRPSAEDRHDVVQQCPHPPLKPRSRPLRLTSVRVLVFMLAVVWAACAVAACGTERQASASHPADGTASIAAPRARAPVSLTAASNGTTVRLFRGQSVSVVLGGTALSWHVPTATGTAVRRTSASGGYPGHQPARATFLATWPGRAVLSSVDDIACLHARPSCAVAQRSWRVVVFVTGPHS